MPKKPSKTLREWCIENKREDLLEEWDYKENKKLGYTPDNVPPYKNEPKMSWKCKVCGGIYPAKIAKRTTNRGCPFCAGKQILKGYNDLETWCKNNDMQHLLNEWDYNKNTIKPDEITPFAHEEMHWVCPICKGPYPLLLSQRTKGKQNCPYCAHKRILKGYNDLETFCKKENRLQLLKMWSPQNKLTPSDVFPTSRDEVEWVCENGHKWSKPIVDMTSRELDFCPECFKSGISFAEKIVAYYISKYFDIVENYRPDFLKNKEIDIYIPVLKIGIEYDGAYYHQTTNNDQIKNDICIQNGIKIIRIREFGLPKLLNCKIFELDKTLKKGLPINFYNIVSECLSFLGISNPDVDIDRDYSLFLQFVKTTTSDNNLYTYCIENNLEYVLREWHPTKNLPLTLQTVSPKCNTEVTWVCTNCGYEYSARIADRTSGRSCQRCKGNNKLFKGYNDLETWCIKNKRPDILEDWDYNANNISPSDITAHNDKPVYWKCKKCGYSYPCSVAHYVAGTSSCPKCAGRRPVRCIETNQEFKGPTEASVVMFDDKKKRKGIALCCQGKQQTAGGYHWEYVDKENIQEKQNDKKDNSNE